MKEPWKECQGCLEELYECYKWQKEGFDAGLTWDKNGVHCFVFVLAYNGEFIIE